MSEITKGHTVKRFDGELAHLNELVLEMGALVLDQIDRAVKALQAEDPAAAREVIERDRLVNDLDVKVDEELVRLLAIRQPMAGDLRDVMTVAKSVNDLERVGDQIRKIALLIEHLYDNGGPTPNHKLLGDIPYLAEYSSNMLRLCLEAFDQLDLAKAVQVMRLDQELEVEFQDALRRLATYILQDARTVGHAIEVVLGLRALERIGGHAKNMAGYVIYLCTGKDVRHVDLATIEKEIVNT